MPHESDTQTREGKADLVFLARQMLRDPYWPFRAARELGRPDAVQFPIQYGHYLKD